MQEFSRKTLPLNTPKIQNSIVQKSAGRPFFLQATPDPFRPTGCEEEEMTIETDIRSIFDEAQSMGTEFEDDMRKRKSK